MHSQLSKMEKMMKLWLKKNELDGDTSFHQIDDWKKRNEPYLNDSELVITTEGGLFHLLNFGDAEEFYELVNSFGYYFELGHAWSLGFYRLDENEKNSLNISYAQKLKDLRWQKKREYILARAEHKCEDCKAATKLEIHHCYYMYGFEPWEYPLDALRCLCSTCHEKRSVTEMVLRGHIASLTNTELNSLIHLITSGFYWYPREKVFGLLNSFGYDKLKMQEGFNEMLKNKQH